jgi:hypothetical protein
MMASRGMGAIRASKMPKAKTITRKDDPNKVKVFKKGGESKVNEAGNYTKPGMRKSLFESIKAGGKGGAPGQWSARKAQLLAAKYKKAGGVYNRQRDGNVFDWLISTAEDFRKIRQRERWNEFKKASEKPKSVDKPKVED